MTLIKTTLPAIAVAGGLTAAILGLGAALASAEPAPPPPAPVQGEQPPAWAPPKPAEFWTGSPWCGTRAGADAGACGSTAASSRCRQTLSPVAANTDTSVTAGVTLRRSGDR